MDRKYLLLVFLGCWLGGMFDGMDSTFMSAVQPKAVPDLLGTENTALVSHYSGIISSCFLIGWMIGGILFGIVGDRFGRVRSMVISILLYAFFTGLSGFSQEWWHLAAFRFLTGLGIGGELVSITTLLTEVWAEKTRAIVVGIVVGSYQTGVLVAGIITQYVSSWRVVFFLGALPAVLTIFLRMSLRESEKWREQKQVSHEDFSFIGEVLSSTHRKNAIIGAVAFGGLLIGYWASLSWIPQWIKSFEGTTNVERGIALFWQGLFALVGCIMSGYICNHIGRKWTIIISYSGCFLASAILFLTNTVFTTYIYIEIACLGFFIGIAQAIMYIYLPELFPTKIRATAVGFCLNAGRFATAVSVLFVSYIVQAFNGYGNAAFFFSLSYLIAVVVAFFASETKDKSLPV